MPTDYYSVLLRAVQALEMDSPEARRSIYSRARRLVQDHLNQNQNQSSKEKIEAEKSTLEDAILRIELERAPNRNSEPDDLPSGVNSSTGFTKIAIKASAQRSRIRSIPIIFASLVGAVILISGGFLFAREKLNEIADQRVRTTIFESELGRFVRVGAITAGLFDKTIILNNVEFHFPEGQLEPIKAKIVSISDFKKFGDTLIQIRISISDFETPLIGAGYVSSLFRDSGLSSLTGSVSFAYNYDVNGRTLRTNFSYDVSEAQHGEIHVALDDFDIRTFSAIAGTLRSISPNDGLVSQMTKWAPLWTGFVDILVQLKLSDIAYTFRDLGFQNRLWTALSKRDNWTGNVSDYSEQKLRPLQIQLETDLETQGYSKELASDMGEKILNYMKYGGELRFTTKISRPFALFMRGGNGVTPYVRTPQQLIDLSAAELQWTR